MIAHKLTLIYSKTMWWLPVTPPLVLVVVVISLPVAVAVTLSRN